MNVLPVRRSTRVHLIAPGAQPLALYCLLLLAPFNGGCSCIYPAAERARTLTGPIDPQRVQAVLRSTPGIEDVSGPNYADTGDVYHNFRWDEELFGHVKHADSGRTLSLRAHTVNHRPDEQTQRVARHLLDELDSRLVDAVSVRPATP